MPALLVDVGHHLVEPDTSGQTVTLSVVSTSPSDVPVAGFSLKAQIVSATQGPYFQDVVFSGGLWNTFPHIESGSPLPTDRTVASGDVSFTQGFESRADGTLVTFTIDTTGIPAGSYQFRLVGTQLGSSSFRRADGSIVAADISNGTLQVRSIWQNPVDPKDINNDGRISPLDVLLLLNNLSKEGSRELEMPSSGDEPPPYYDVDGDGHISPKDGLGVINCLNGFGCVSTPSPILAAVTPDFSPKTPDSTSVDDATPNVVPPKDTNPEQGSPTDSEGCYYYDEQLDGTTYCYDAASETTVPIAESSYADDSTLYATPASSTESGGISLGGRSVLVAPPSPTSIDEYFARSAEDVSERYIGDALLDLALDEIFASA
ncbi:MAG: hypothetical protein H6822_33000 [Planctomycetaceae bacterium]|nr:hypothetical protein [Planctomycetales bacterium]MCB9927004.1 hypothetical protein [Planctomycetaceae bacterium]